MSQTNKEIIKTLNICIERQTRLVEDKIEELYILEQDLEYYRNKVKLLSEVHDEPNKTN